jgi:CRP/FNR family transcriptional regulator
MDGDWTRRLAALDGIDPQVRQALVKSSRLLRVSAGTTLFRPGEAPGNFVLVISGEIRIGQTSESGREIVLYRVGPGEGCALTIACLIAGDDYVAEAQAETDVELVALPRPVFDDLIATSVAFRQFVFGSFSQRLTDLFRLIEEIAFQRFDVRLAHKLLERAGTQSALEITHQQLAVELGTAREVVSRHLGELVRRGWIEVGRGEVRLRDRKALEVLAGAP